MIVTQTATTTIPPTTTMIINVVSQHIHITLFAPNATTEKERTEIKQTDRQMNQWRRNGLCSMRKAQGPMSLELEGPTRAELIFLNNVNNLHTAQLWC